MGEIGISRRLWQVEAGIPRLRLRPSPVVALNRAISGPPKRRGLKVSGGLGSTMGR
jgi:hypothetical protein